MISTVTLLVSSGGLPQLVLAETVDVQGFASLCHNLLLLFSLSLLLASLLLNLQKVQLVKTPCPHKHTTCGYLFSMSLKQKISNHSNNKKYKYINENEENRLPSAGGCCSPIPCCSALSSSWPHPQPSCGRRRPPFSAAQPVQYILKYHDSTA